MMTFNKKIADEFLAAISLLPKQLGVYVDDDWGDVDLYYLNDFEKKVESIDPDAIIEHGMSKIVIISQKLGDAVIKIPCNGYYLTTYKREDEDDSYDDDSDCESSRVDTWYGFEGAHCKDVTDYCLSEYEKYKNLKEWGLECFAAETIFYKEVNNKRVFIQEKVISLNEDYSKRNVSKDSETTAEKWYSEGKLHPLSTEWVASCIDRYGKDSVEDFWCYCSEFDKDILFDAHDSNYGYRLDGTPAFLDFSNYMD